jgi:hypothetical protein
LLPRATSGQLRKSIPGSPEDLLRQNNICCDKTRFDATKQDLLRQKQDLLRQNNICCDTSRFVAIKQDLM